MKKEEGFSGQRTIIVPELIINEVKSDPINQSLYITDIGFYPTAKSHYRIRRNGCSQYILMYCIEGEGWISIEDKKIIVQENQYFIIPKNIAHSYGASNSNPWSIYWIHYSGSHAKFLSEQTANAISVKPSKISRIEDRIQLFEEMMQNLEMGYSLENLRYANICLWHFLASFQYLSQFRQVRKIQEGDLVESSIIFMKDSLKTRLTLEQLANQARVSTSHYSLVFKNKTGRSPLDYFIQLKIQYACQLLDHTSLHIKEVAQRIGYDDPYYFSRIFKKLINLSPKKYRLNLKG